MPLTQHEQDQIQAWIHELLDADREEFRAQFLAWKDETREQMKEFGAGVDAFLVRIARLIMKGSDV